MTLNDLGNLGEAVSAVAVVVSLLYLAVQVGQNTRMMRVSTHHALNTAWNALHVAYGSDPAVSKPLARGSEDYSQLDRDERLRYALLMRASFGLNNDMFLQYRERLVSDQEQRGRFDMLVVQLLRSVESGWFQQKWGVMDPDHWEGFMRSVDVVVGSEGGRRAFARNRDFFAPKFAEAVDAVIAKRGA